jgi:hypothetical protein
LLDCGIFGEGTFVGHINTSKVATMQFLSSIVAALAAALCCANASAQPRAALKGAELNMTLQEVLSVKDGHFRRYSCAPPTRRPNEHDPATLRCTSPAGETYAGYPVAVTLSFFEDRLGQVSIVLGLREKQAVQLEHVMAELWGRPQRVGYGNWGPSLRWAMAHDGIFYEDILGRSQWIIMETAEWGRMRQRNMEAALAEAKRRQLLDM